MPSYMYSSNVYPGFPNGIKQLAYTATFGGGFSSTIAIESRGDFGYIKPASGTRSSPPSAVATSANAEYVNQWDTGYELVGNVRYDSSWGYVQLAGHDRQRQRGLHRIQLVSTGQICTANYNPLVGPTKYGEYGFVGSFGVKLPMIAPGDEFHFEGTYGHGFIGGTDQHGRSQRPLQLVEQAGDGRRHPCGFEPRSDHRHLERHGRGVWADRFLGRLRHFHPLLDAAMAVERGGRICRHHRRRQHLARPRRVSSESAPRPPVSTPNGAKANCSSSPATSFGRRSQNFNIGFEAEYLHLSSTLQNPNSTFVAAGEPGLPESSVIYHLRLEREF